MKKKKQCSVCRKSLPLDNFGPRSDRPDPRPACRKCEQEKKRQRRSDASYVTAPRKWEFDPLLAYFTMRYSRPPRQASREIRAYGPIFTRYEPNNKQDELDIVCLTSPDVSIRTRPLYGHPTGVRYEMEN